VAVTPIVVLEGGEYRIAQGDHGPPFVQFLDEESKTWIAIRKVPSKMEVLEALLVKYVSRGARSARDLKKAKVELEGYKNGFDSRGFEIEELRKLKERLTTLAEA
jgi:hypothetical protein